MFAVAASARLITRRVRTDIVALSGIALLIALAAGLAVVVPAHIDSTLDRAAREAVAAAGSETDLLLRTSVADPVASSSTTAESVLSYAEEVSERLPDLLGTAVSRVTAGIVGPELQGTAAVGDVRVRIGVLAPGAEDELAIVAGELPPQENVGASGALDVVVSSAAAEVAQIAVGDTLSVGDQWNFHSVNLRIVGVIEPTDPSAQEWTDLPGVWDPRLTTSRTGGSGATLTVLSQAASFDRAATEFSESSEATIRASVDPAVLDLRAVGTVGERIDTLETSPWTLTESVSLEVNATSGYEAALENFSVEVRLATAQLSVAAAGLLGIAVLVCVLASTALARRRRSQVELIRSRGASIGLVAAHAALEALGVTLVGATLGVGVTAVLGLHTRSFLLLGAVMTVVAAAPVATVLAQIAPMPTSTRLLFMRITGAAALGATTITAVVALNGGADVQGAGIDALALAAPILCAATVALILAPLPGTLLRAVSTLATRTRGPGALLAASSARDGRSLLTLVALILASSVAITSMVLVQTVAAGQEAASWRTVNADVRVDRATDAAALLDSFRSGGATAAAVAEFENITVQGDSSSLSSTVLVVNADYASLLAALPPNRLRDRDASAVDRLVAGGQGGATASPDTAIPVLFDERLTKLADGGDLTVDIDGTPVLVTALSGIAPLERSDSGPTMIVNREDLAAHLAASAGLTPGRAVPDVLAPSTVMAVGGSAATVAATVTPEEGVAVVRLDVLAEQRDAALVAGVTAASVQSLAGTALLAVLALLVTTVIGVRRRGRSLALLGALGVPRRTGITLAVGELLPLVVSGVIGGAIAAAVVLATAGSAFRADILAGGPAPLVVDPLMVLALVAVAAAALGLAVLCDLPLSRRVRTADILRTGEES
jgi:putative ABC transport system permease protein